MSNEMRGWTVSTTIKHEVEAVTLKEAKEKALTDLCLAAQMGPGHIDNLDLHQIAEITQRRGFDESTE